MSILRHDTIKWHPSELYFSLVKHILITRIFFSEEEILAVPRLTNSKGFESPLLSYHFRLGAQTDRVYFR